MSVTIQYEISYEIRKNCALYQVFIVGSNIVQFTSCKRANCVDFIASNMPEPEEITLV